MTIIVDEKQRQDQIIQFVEKNPFCSKDGIFIKGKISKSRLTEKILECLVSTDKIKTIHTENGKMRYYLQPKHANLELLKYLFRDSEYKLKKTTKRYPELKSLFEKYATIFRLRMKVLEHEQKVLDSTPSYDSLNLSDTIKLLEEINTFIEKPQEDARNHMRYIDTEIQRDEYYLEHELHSKPRLNYYPFQAEKFRHVRRQLSELVDMKMKGDRRSLKKADYEKNVRKIQSKSDFEHEEIFKRLVAEHNRTLYQNPEMTSNKVMLIVTRERLREINRNHLLSKNYEYERRVLEDWRDVISKIPIGKLLTSPEYEEGIPRNLLSRFSKKKRIQT